MKMSLLQWVYEMGLARKNKAQLPMRDEKLFPLILILVVACVYFTHITLLNPSDLVRDGIQSNPRTYADVDVVHGEAPLAAGMLMLMLAATLFSRSQKEKDKQVKVKVKVSSEAEPGSAQAVAPKQEQDAPPKRKGKGRKMKQLSKEPQTVKSKHVGDVAKAEAPRECVDVNVQEKLPQAKCFKDDVEDGAARGIREVCPVARGNANVDRRNSEIPAKKLSVAVPEEGSMDSRAQPLAKNSKSKSKSKLKLSKPKSKSRSESTAERSSSVEGVAAVHSERNASNLGEKNRRKKQLSPSLSAPLPLQVQATVAAPQKAPTSAGRARTRNTSKALGNKGERQVEKAAPTLFEYSEGYRQNHKRGSEKAQVSWQSREVKGNGSYQARANRAYSLPLQHEKSNKCRPLESFTGTSVIMRRAKSASLYDTEYSLRPSQPQPSSCTGHSGGDKLLSFLKAIGMEIYYGLLSSKKINFATILQMNEYEFERSFELPLYAKRRIWSGLMQLHSRSPRSRADKSTSYIVNNPGNCYCDKRSYGVDVNMSQLEALATGMTSAVLD